MLDAMPPSKSQELISQCMQSCEVLAKSVSLNNRAAFRRLQREFQQKFQFSFKRHSDFSGLDWKVRFKLEFSLAENCFHQLNRPPKASRLWFRVVYGDSFPHDSYVLSPKILDFYKKPSKIGVQSEASLTSSLWGLHFFSHLFELIKIWLS